MSLGAMAMKVEKTLSDGSKVWNVELWEEGKQIYIFSCRDEEHAKRLERELEDAL